MSEHSKLKLSRPDSQVVVDLTSSGVVEDRAAGEACVVEKTPPAALEVGRSAEEPVAWAVGSRAVVGHTVAGTVVDTGDTIAADTADIVASSCPCAADSSEDRPGADSWVEGVDHMAC